MPARITRYKGKSCEKEQKQQMGGNLSKADGEEIWKNIETLKEHVRVQNGKIGELQASLKDAKDEVRVLSFNIDQLRDEWNRYENWEQNQDEEAGGIVVVDAVGSNEPPEEGALDDNGANDPPTADVGTPRIGNVISHSLHDDFSDDY